MGYRIVAVLAVVLVTLASVAVPSASHAQNQEEHCVIRVDGEPGNIRCFATFADAIHFATGTRVRLDPDIPASDVMQRMLDQGVERNQERAQSAMQATVIGIGYGGQYYNGASTTWTVQGNGCRDYPEIGAATILASWNDRISSSRSFAGCRTMRHYENSHYGGSVRDCTPNCSHLGVMNNETSSLKWFR